MKNRGFTLIELLAVVLIMGVLTAVAVPQYKKSLERSRVAEAMQMLPAIFDSRERLLTENNYTIRELEEIAPEDALQKLEDVSPFSRLDIDMKGRSAAPLLWQTDNFLYNLYEQKDIALVSATLERGSYKGMVLYYDGNSIMCCDPRGDGADWNDEGVEHDTDYNVCHLFVDESNFIELCR